MGFLLAQLGRAATRGYRCALMPIGVKPRETAALMRLQDGPLSQQELGTALDMDPSNLVALLNDLEARGFAVRSRDPQDRRRHLVGMTDQGRAALDEVVAAAADVDDEFFSALTQEERELLHELLVKIGESTEIPPPVEVAEAEDGC